MKMKHVAFLVFFGLISEALLGAGEAVHEAVIDTKGKKLRADANYHIIPAVPFTICGFVSCFTGGGLALGSVDDESCPLDVVVEKANEGLPLRLLPFDTKKGVIRVSTDLNIFFSDADERCPHHSTVWRLDDFDASVGQTYVTTGGVVGTPNQHTILNWFKILKYEDAYKLVYCPSVCPSCHHPCKDLGVFVDENNRMRLALSDFPFKVKFNQSSFH
ncbi:kunitz trypsin inhibitor 2-like [Vigna unguiculata]|uniref:Kunitz inhibitor ST1-like n=1 Tax=Vigna unguiculata TaxID=3917 RepID=A0A4D6LU10_VIGUN|nr:kunitz trypsin inhibitor 2-like [Vigna unguiculata]QCD92519.1 Kunitz inhibitor ST1-like [Vigna unguiculata]